MANFGLDPEATYFFEVEITTTNVIIREVLDRTEVRATIPRTLWNDIADIVKADWNMRLKKHGRKAGRWTSATLLDRLLGKELTLLAWAMEDATTEGIERAVANWNGLAPSERWWLYTMANSASNQSTFGKDHGWRKGIRIALTEN